MTTEDGTQWSRALDVLLLLSHSDRPAPSLLGRDIIYDLPMVIHLREKRVELSDDIAT